MRSECPEGLKTDALLQQVEAIRNAYSEQQGEQAEKSSRFLDQWLLPLCAVSPYIARTLTQYPTVLPTLIAHKSIGPTGDLPPGLPSVEFLHNEITALHTQAYSELKDQDINSVEASEQRVLRIFRHRHMVRILWCDLTENYSLEQTLEQLSILAETCVRAADQWTYNALSERFGTPLDENKREQRLIIIGMGKLGGGELNVSSDIDIICVYPAAGHTEFITKALNTENTGRDKTRDNSDFFRRCVQRFCKLLNSMTEDGFVYRVDTRLRPFGESGPPVINFDGLENYYFTQARDWERYAMIKGRALCGHHDDIQVLEQLITPFVYRRYLDYNAFDALRSLKRKIALSLLKQSMQDNIKLGSGGIREIEFIGQAFQLVRGGQDTRLRIRPIMQVLSLLVELNLLPETEVIELQSAYRYLRRVENAIQAMRDEQVHTLPNDPSDKERLLCMLDEPDWEFFQHTLTLHRNGVSQYFNQLFAMEDADNESVNSDVDTVLIDQAHDLWVALGSDAIDDQQRSMLLENAGFSSDEALLASIATLTRGSFYQHLAADSQLRVERLVPSVLMLAKECNKPGVTLGRVLNFIRVVAGRGGYLQVLTDQPKALQHLLTLFSNSRWIAGFVASQPIVIDELLTHSSVQTDAQSVFKETTEFVERLKDSDLDVQMDSLRQYRQTHQMRIACAQLDGSLSVMQVSDQLTWLAESIVSGVLTLVGAPLNDRFGKPGFGDGSSRVESHLGVLAYGKLGGVELGFGSDLDLVFMHDSVGPEQVTDGLKSIDNGLYYAKLAQKFVHFMGTRTPAGILYEIDLRLRPNGSAGVMVCSIESYAKYQSSDAWTWEHQALIRARLIVGHSELQSQFSTIRQSVLASKRPLPELQKSVATMRERMRAAHGNKKAGIMDLKQDSGGVADIEFIVQFLVLAYSSEHPELLTYTDNIRILECVEALRFLPVKDTKALQSAYLMLRERLHRQALDEESPLETMDESLEKLAQSVIRLRIKILGSPEL